MEEHSKRRPDSRRGDIQDKQELQQESGVGGKGRRTKGIERQEVK